MRRGLISALVIAFAASSGAQATVIIQDTFEGTPCQLSAWWRSESQTTAEGPTIGGAINGVSPHDGACFSYVHYQSDEYSRYLFSPYTGWPSGTTSARNVHFAYWIYFDSVTSGGSFSHPIHQKLGKWYMRRTFSENASSCSASLPCSIPNVGHVRGSSAGGTGVPMYWESHLETYGIAEPTGCGPSDVGDGTALQYNQWHKVEGYIALGTGCTGGASGCTGCDDKIRVWVDGHETTTANNWNAQGGENNWVLSAFWLFGNASASGASVNYWVYIDSICVGTSYDDCTGAPYYGTAAAAEFGAPDVTNPTDPSSLVGTPSYPTRVSLSWTASTDDVGVTGYDVERCTGSGCTPSSGIGTAATNSYSDATVSASSTYVYRVRAFDAAGNHSGYATSADVTTPAPDTSNPSSTTGLAIASNTNAAVGLSWTAATDNYAVTGYSIERCVGTSCTPSSQLNTSATTAFSDTSVAPSTTYGYRVRAYDEAGNYGGYSSTVPVTTPAAPGPGANLGGAWNFNEGSGTTAADASGNSNTGTFNGGVSWTASGQHGAAAVFAGTSNNYVNVPNSSSINVNGTALTISFWASPIDNSGNDEVVLAKPWTIGTQNVPTYQYGIEYAAAHRYDLYLGMTDNTRVGPYSISAPSGVWRHIAYTYDGANVKGYLDGALSFTAAQTKSVGSRTTALRMGVDSTGQQPFKGSLDDVRIYARALTIAEIQSDMASGVATVTCGDGTIGPGETCDPYYPGDPFNGDTCTAHGCTGTGLVCTAACQTDASGCSACGNTAPDTVTNMTAELISTSIAKLSWTAPGADGSTGTVTSYDIRYSTAADITDQTSFDAANVAPVQIGTLLSAGNTQYAYMQVAPSKTYYFALVANDELSTPSGVSTHSAGANQVTTPAPTVYLTDDFSSGDYSSWCDDTSNISQAQCLADSAHEAYMTIEATGGHAADTHVQRSEYIAGAAGTNDSGFYAAFFADHPLLSGTEPTYTGLAADDVTIDQWVKTTAGFTGASTSGGAKLWILAAFERWSYTCSTTCTGGVNQGNACSSDGDCPAYVGPNTWSPYYVIAQYQDSAVNGTGAFLEIEVHRKVGSEIWPAYIQNQSVNRNVNDGSWHHVAIRCRLNTPGFNDGVIQVWIDDVLRTEYATVNFRDTYEDFGFNDLVLSRSFPDALSAGQSSYRDDVVLRDSPAQNPVTDVCGDGAINGSEVCDTDQGGIFGPDSCASHGCKGGGTLTCVSCTSVTTEGCKGCAYPGAHHKANPKGVKVK